MDKLFIAYGVTLATLIDCKDPTNVEFSNTADGLIHVQCPRCDAVVDETMDRCPDCNLYLVFDGSKTWRKQYSVTPKTAWDNFRLRPMGTGERNILRAMRCKTWAKGTIGKLVKVRGQLGEVFTGQYIKLAMPIRQKMGGSAKAAQNYILSIAIKDTQEQMVSLNQDDEYEDMSWEDL